MSIYEMSPQAYWGQMQKLKELIHFLRNKSDKLRNEYEDMKAVIAERFDEMEIKRQINQRASQLSSHTWTEDSVKIRPFYDILAKQGQELSQAAIAYYLQPISPYKTYYGPKNPYDEYFARDAFEQDVDYDVTLLRNAMADLARLKLMMRYPLDSCYDLKDKMRMLSSVAFKRCLQLMACRTEYEPSFRDKGEGGFKSNAEIAEWITSSSGTREIWRIPIRSNWFTRVFRRGLGMNDINKKPIVVMNVWDIPDEEQPALVSDDIRLYRAKTCYVKVTNNGQWLTQRGRIYLQGTTPKPSDWEQYKLPQDSTCTAKQLNEWNPEYRGQLVIKEGKYRIVQLPMNSNYSNPHTATLGFYTRGPKVFVEDRYIAQYVKPGVEKKLVASGTSPLRAVAVLRNRITQALMEEMNV